MEFLRRIFKRESKADEPILPEAAEADDSQVEQELAFDDSGEAAPVDAVVKVEDDTIVPSSPPRPPAEEDDTIVPSSPPKPPPDEELALAGEIQWRTKHALTVGYASHVGRVRQRNEDSALVISTESLGESTLPPYGLYIVADGMGGHSEGHMASQLAARIAARDVMSHIFPPFLQIGASEPSQPVQSILESSLQTANWEVHRANAESGTTLTATLVLGERLYIAHVGDSRAYLIQDEDGEAELLTLDHSFVQRLQDTGQITEEEAAVHPQRNILYRAIGQGDRLSIDTFSRPLPKPSWLVLCSDGLWGVVDIEFLKASVTSAATPQQACDELVEAALHAGAPDNVTVIIVRYE